MLVVTPRRPVEVRTGRRIDLRGLADRLAEPITIRWAVLGIVALIGLNVAAGLLEPVPANPAQPDPWFINVLTTVIALAMLAALGGLLVRRRWGMCLSLFAASVAVVLVVGCPVSGHHHFGLWWVGETACIGAWAALSLVGFRSPRPAARVEPHRRGLARPGMAGWPGP
jgi:hypothetical protein